MRIYHAEVKNSCCVVRKYKNSLAVPLPFQSSLPCSPGVCLCQLLWGGCAAQLVPSAEEPAQGSQLCNDINSDFLSLPLNIWLSVSWCNKASPHFPSSQCVFCPFKRAVVAVEGMFISMNCCWGAPCNEYHPPHEVSVNTPLPLTGGKHSLGHMQPWEIPWAKFCCLGWMCWYPDPTDPALPGKAVQGNNAFPLSAPLRAPMGAEICLPHRAWCLAVKWWHFQHSSPLQQHKCFSCVW